MNPATTSFGYFDFSLFNPAPAAPRRRVLLHAAALGAIGAIDSLGPLSALAAESVDDRVALVVGNSTYTGNPQLPNATKDAAAIADALLEKHFRVIKVQDGSRVQMLESIAELRKSLQGRSGVGFLYFAGHGLQLDWRNFMIPIDAQLAQTADIPRQAVDVQLVIDALKAARSRVNIVVLDACRNNPFGPLATGRGLTPMDAPPGTFLAYATAPGNVAEDGDETEGVGHYAQYLVNELRGPSAPIEDVFKRVRLQVRKKTLGRQIPWESTSLEEDFYFDPAAKAQKESAAEDARQGALELAGWNAIKDSKDPLAVTEHMLRFPSGRYTELAQMRLDQLQARRVDDYVTRDGVTVAASKRSKYSKGDVFEYDFYENFALKKRLPNLRFEITAIDDERVVINGGEAVLDHNGNVYRTQDKLYQPGFAKNPVDPAVGKKWRSDYTVVDAVSGNVIANVSLQFRVMALERIVVPAGEFMTYRVEGSGYEDSGSGGRRTASRVTWADASNSAIVIKEELVTRLGGYIKVNTLRELRRLSMSGK